MTAILCELEDPRVSLGGAAAVKFNDHELPRVSVQRADNATDSYLVNAEPMDGDPCYVYGLQRKSQEVELCDLSPSCEG